MASLEPIFSRVSPETHDIQDTRVGQQCQSFRHKGIDYYTHFANTDLNYDEWISLETIRELPEKDGLYNYIIYRANDGGYALLFAKHNLPNELASKHNFLYTYIQRNQLTPEMRVYMAGELHKSGDTYKINFQSGTYIPSYKEKWMEKTGEESSEKDWAKVVVPFMKDILGGDVEYDEGSSFLKRYPVLYHPETYRKLETMRKPVRFFKDKLSCQLYKLYSLYISKGAKAIPTFSLRAKLDNGKRLSNYVERKPDGTMGFIDSVNVVDIKGFSLDEFQDRIRSGGRKTRRRRKRHNKMSRRK